MGAGWTAVKSGLRTIGFWLTWWEMTYFRRDVEKFTIFSLCILLKRTRGASNTASKLLGTSAHLW